VQSDLHSTGTKSFRLTTGGCKAKADLEEQRQRQSGSAVSLHVLVGCHATAALKELSTPVSAAQHCDFCDPIHVCSTIGVILICVLRTTNLHNPAQVGQQLRPNRVANMPEKQDHCKLDKCIFSSFFLFQYLRSLCTMKVTTQLNLLLYFSRCKHFRKRNFLFYHAAFLPLLGPFRTYKHCSHGTQYL